MSTTRRNIAIVYSIILGFSVFLVSYRADGIVLRSLLVALAVLLDIVLTRIALRRKSLISFALGVIPAILLWMFFCGFKFLWLILSLLCSVGLFFLYRGRLPDTRPTTDAWIGCLILTIILSVTPFIIIALNA